MAADPTASATREAALELLSSRRFVLLTGAGLSTDSGIPDYRGPGRPPRQPMTFQQLLGSTEAHQRYWARGFLGWGRMGYADPNAGHEAAARLQELDAVDLLVTQNVDGLHERAGADTLALHGRISEVVCLDCGALSRRTEMQARMDAANPTWAVRHADRPVNPDGDVELDDTRGFAVPPCLVCGGRLKPDVVFFGENVPRPRVQRVIEAVERTQALLVAGSSLTVMSGFRFVRQAAKQGTPVVIVNRGTTRGDDLADLVVEAGTSEFLGDLVRTVERARVS
ncbi:NAD-dependent protein deacetylase [Nocardioidaceae bacterium]|nr:NAD-dependent protein deacetylase [Nocardioidaceae bacterium]